MPNLRRLFRYVRPYRVQMTVAIIALLASSLIILALPWALSLLVDSVFTAGDAQLLNQVALGLLVLFVVQSLFFLVEVYLLAYVGQHVVADLRLAIHRHLLVLPLHFYDSRRTGEMVSRVTNDVTVVQATLTDTPAAFLRQVITFAGGLALMLLLNWQLTLFILVLLPPLILCGIFFGRRLERLSTQVQDRLADSTTVLEESISGVRVVKSFGRENFEQARYAERIALTLRTAMRRIRVRAEFLPLITFLSFAAVTAVLWFGGQQVLAGTLTAGELVAFIFYMFMVAGPLGEFAGLYSQLREALGASKRIFEILDTPTEVPEPGSLPDAGGATGPGKGMRSLQPQGAGPGNGAAASVEIPFARSAVPPIVQGEVRFRGVGFGYDHRTPVLHGVDLTAQPGEVIAVVGPSGVGKTTLVNLIPRFYELTEGSLEIDGMDVRTLPLAVLRAQIGLVPQETFLFGGTVHENIAYGRLDADEDAIRDAARAAFAHDFIMHLPEGYETTVGERGVRLSAGQRQRIAIARALLKDPRILILDEATSALDTESERWVQAALERLMQGRTSFVIAHRLSTVQRADRIVVLQGGRIVETGRHGELLAQGGLYAHLWSLQFADLAEDGKLMR
jgi:subfamily B ATP-binding cassette protein MsbA